MDQQKCPDFLRQYFPFWDKLTGAERQKLCRAAKPARFDKGAHIHGGDGSCTYGCLGYGDCAKVCPNDAICIENGIAHVDSRKCTGCGMCEAVCPQNALELRW